MAHVETYLPAGSAVTVQQEGKKPVNYVTSKEVIVTQSAAQVCPLSLTTRTASGVWTRDRITTVQGVSIWYTERSLRRRIVVPETDTAPDVYTRPLTKIDYDIPTNLGAGYAFRVAGEFHRIAVKCSKSTWILRTGDMPYNLLAMLEEDGCTVNADPIDPSATKTLIARAIIALQEQVETYVRGANETLESATERLGSEELTEKEATDKCLAEAKALEKRLEKYRSTITPGAEKLGITAAAWAPERLSTVAKVTATEMRKRAKAYRRGVIALSTIDTVDSRALHQLASQDALPVEIMSDALRDAGDEKTADKLNETFPIADMEV
jgi:hypothetical protein